MRNWYLSLCMGGVWSVGWFKSNQQSRHHPYRVTNTSVAQIQQFSPDDGHMHARNMQKREINKHFKRNCALSWIYLREPAARGKLLAEIMFSFSTSSPKHTHTCSKCFSVLKAVWQVSEFELVKAVTSTGDDSWGKIVRLCNLRSTASYISLIISSSAGIL